MGRAGREPAASGGFGAVLDGSGRRVTRLDADLVDARGGAAQDRRHLFV